ncbi:MAG: hypothetical protein MUP47_03195 [Phycisphaerae bacterium]|nr:hypothetical protein [Phycisphaerae bacterium]
MAGKVARVARWVRSHPAITSLVSVLVIVVLIALFRGKVVIAMGFLDQRAGAVTAIATVFLAGFTALYVVLVKKQADRLLQQDRVSIARSIRAIIDELKDNASLATGTAKVPLSTREYTAHRSVLKEGGATTETLRAMDDAARSCLKVTLLIAGGTLGHMAAADPAWEQAKKNIVDAAKAVDDDKSLQQFLEKDR